MKQRSRSCETNVPGFKIKGLKDDFESVTTIPQTSSDDDLENIENQLPKLQNRKKVSNFNSRKISRCAATNENVKPNSGAVLEILENNGKVSDEKQKNITDYYPLVNKKVSTSSIILKTDQVTLSNNKDTTKKQRQTKLNFQIIGKAASNSKQIIRKIRLDNSERICKNADKSGIKKLQHKDDEKDCTLLDKERLTISKTSNKFNNENVSESLNSYSADTDDETESDSKTISDESESNKNTTKKTHFCKTNKQNKSDSQDIIELTRPVELVDSFVFELFHEETLNLQRSGSKNVDTNKNDKLKLGPTVNKISCLKKAEGRTAKHFSKSRVFPPGQWYPSEEFLLKQNKKTVTDTEKSRVFVPKPWKPSEQFLSKNKKTTTSTQNRDNKISDTSLIEERETIRNAVGTITSVLDSETRNKTSNKAPSDEFKPIKSCFTDKTINQNKTDSKFSLVTKSLDTEENESRYNLRSKFTYKKFVNEVKNVRGLSIDNLNDWYDKDENYYKAKCNLMLKDLIIPKEQGNKGNAEICYTYLLLDSRICKNKSDIKWIDFINAIFYIGKGQNKRAFKHAKDATKWLIDGDSSRTSNKKEYKKYLKIKEIWDSGNPVRVFLVTENITKAEALTREATMIEVMGLRRLCNEIRGTYNNITRKDGVISQMAPRDCYEVGATLLLEARDIFTWKETTDIYPNKLLVIERINSISDGEDELYFEEKEEELQRAYG